MENLYLNNYISREYVNNILEFNYAGISGIAESIGWQILLFRLKESSLIQAITFDEIFENNILLDIANKILKDLEFPIRIWDDLIKIKNVFGKETSQDNIFYETHQVTVIRYHYLISKNYFLTFSISKNKLIGLEIIYNNEIINNILPYRCKKIIQY